MPQIFKIGPYSVYFWSNEGNPLEPVHVHITEGRPYQNATKIWLTSGGSAVIEVDMTDDAAAEDGLTCGGTMRVYVEAL